MKWGVGQDPRAGKKISGKSDQIWTSNKPSLIILYQGSFSVLENYTRVIWNVHGRESKVKEYKEMLHYFCNFSVSLKFVENKNIFKKIKLKTTIGLYIKVPTIP